jgi:signal transduction histidine kinase
LAPYRSAFHFFGSTENNMDEKPEPAFDLRLTGLVHDLNNVFQTLIAAAGLLSADSNNAFLSAAIARSAERGKNLVTSILSSDGESAPFESILTGAVSFVEDSRIAGGPEIRFTRSIERSIELRHNWAWERVLINLFSNAISAMPEGGAIYVSARHVAGEVEIVVRDEGLGIAPEILARVFNPHVSTSGSGMGLHIVQTIVKQNGGHVEASNRTDRSGAEFTIRVPCPIEKQSQMAAVAITSCG